MIESVNFSHLAVLVDMTQLKKMSWLKVSIYLSLSANCRIIIVPIKPFCSLLVRKTLASWLPITGQICQLTTENPGFNEMKPKQVKCSKSNLCRMLLRMFSSSDIMPSLKIASVTSLLYATSRHSPSVICNLKCRQEALKWSPSVRNCEIMLALCMFNCEYA